MFQQPSSRGCRWEQECTINVMRWAAIFGVVVVAVTITEVVGLTQNWQNAAIYTVILFTALIFALRPAWVHRTFWEDLAAIFVLHLLAVIVLEQGFPSAAKDFHGIPSTIALMVEGLIIASILWKRSMRSKPDRR
jgi:hypothetical protein